MADSSPVRLLTTPERTADGFRRELRALTTATDAELAGAVLILPATPAIFHEAGSAETLMAIERAKHALITDTTCYKGELGEGLPAAEPPKPAESIDRGEVAEVLRGLIEALESGSEPIECGKCGKALACPDCSASIVICPCSVCAQKQGHAAGCWVGHLMSKARRLEQQLERNYIEALPG